MGHLTKTLHALQSSAHPDVCDAASCPDAQTMPALSDCFDQMRVHAQHMLMYCARHVRKKGLHVLRKVRLKQGLDVLRRVCLKQGLRVLRKACLKQGRAWSGAPCRGWR